MDGLSLIIPVHNSKEVIEKSLDDYFSTFSKKFKNFEMIIVCNDCWDGSPEFCRSFIKKFPLKVIEIPQRGKGYALITGFNKAEFDSIGFLDADNVFDLNETSRMIDFLKTNDIVIASKYNKSLRNQDSFIRRLISIFGGIFSRIFFNLTFKDTQAGAKFFKKRVWDKIGNNFICKGFDFDIEFLFKAVKNNFKIKEFYLPPKKYEKFSTFRLKYIPGMVKRLLKLRFLI